MKYYWEVAKVGGRSEYHTMVARLFFHLFLGTCYKFFDMLSTLREEIPREGVDLYCSPNDFLDLKSAVNPNDSLTGKYALTWNMGVPGT